MNITINIPVERIKALSDNVKLVEGEFVLVATTHNGSLYLISDTAEDVYHRDITGTLAYIKLTKEYVEALKELGFTEQSN